MIPSRLLAAGARAAGRPAIFATSVPLRESAARQLSDNTRGHSGGCVGSPTNRGAADRGRWRRRGLVSFIGDADPRQAQAFAGAADGAGAKAGKKAPAGGGSGCCTGHAVNGTHDAGCAPAGGSGGFSPTGVAAAPAGRGGAGNPAGDNPSSSGAFGGPSAPAADSVEADVPVLGGDDSFDVSRHPVWNPPPLDFIFENNKKWVAKMTREDPSFFSRQMGQHRPDFLYIGCSDARLSVQGLMGLEQGQLFVHRNIANMVVNTDINFLSVLTYAVEYLKVKNIIVCGHYDCGGVRAAMRNQDHGLIEHWVMGIRDVARLHRKELRHYTDPEAMHRRLVELNIQEQALKLYANPVVQRNQALHGWPHIHAFVYDVGEGLLRELDVCFKEILQKYRHVYSMYKVDADRGAIIAAAAAAAGQPIPAAAGTFAAPAAAAAPGPSGATAATPTPAPAAAAGATPAAAVAGSTPQEHKTMATFEPSPKAASA